MVRDFYAAVLPPTGTYSLFQNGHNSFYESLDALAAATENRAATADLYYCTSALASADSRKAENATTRRTVCFDIDAGPKKYAKHGDKVYQTQRAALVALREWCVARDFVPRFVVSSGAGLHVYFALDADLPQEDWRPLATAVKQAALDDGLRIDPTVTADMVRILRPPGTLHNDGSAVRILTGTNVTYSVAEIGARFPYQPPAQRRRMNDEFMEAAYVGPPRSFIKIVKHCPAIAAVAAVRGDVPEPYWRATLGVVKFTVEADTACHAISEGHPDYDYEETEAKMARWTAGPATCSTFAGENPSACAGCKWRGQITSPIVLGSMTDAEIQADPRATAVREEAQAQAAETLQVATAPAEAEAEEAPPWAGHLPESVVVTADFKMVTYVDIKQESPTGEKITKSIPIVLSPVPFWFPQWADSVSDGDPAVLDMAKYNPSTRAVVRYRMPVATVSKKDKLVEFLGNAGIVTIDPTHTRAIQEYVQASLERIRLAGNRPKIARRLGVDYEGDRLFAAHGHLIAGHDGSVTTAVVAPRLHNAANEYIVDMPPGRDSWAATEWEPFILERARRHAAFLNKHYALPGQAPYRLAIMLAWASPMLPFVEGTFVPKAELAGGGLTVSLYSTSSGRGKSHAQRNAALAFGDPNKLVQQRDDRSSTENARTEAVAYAGTLPVFMDEMGEVQPKATANLISMVGNGATRVRMNKDFALTGGSKVALINLISSNRSQRELAAADRTDSEATQMRMLEIGCDSVPDVRSTDYEQDLAALQDCRGAIGLIIHSTMAKLGGAGLNKLGLECSAKAREMVNGAQNGRFLWRALGAMLAVRRMLRLHGLQVFDTAELVTEFKKWYDAGYAFAADNILPSDGNAMVSLLLSDLMDRTLVTTVREHRDGRNVMPHNDRMPAQVVARVITEERIAYVATEAVRDWAFKRRTALQVFTHRAREADALLPVNPATPDKLIHRINLLRGTSMNVGNRQACYAIRLGPLAAESADGGGNVLPLFADQPNRAAEPAQKEAK